jgi:membrane-associated phospholipid phosphatase
MGESPLWSLDWVRAVQGWGDWLLGPMLGFTFFGSQEFFLLLLLLVYWCLHKRRGMDLAALILVSVSINSIVKVFAQQPRPFWLDPALQRAAANSFSFPSGHAQNAAIVFGYFAWVLLHSAAGRRRTWGAAGLAALALVVGVSRTYLGVHFPGDVLAGWLLGLILLALYLWLSPAVAAWLRKRSLLTHIVLAALVAAVILAANAAGLALARGVSAMPAAFYALGAASGRDEAAAAAGMTLGLWIGLALEARYVRFVVDGPILQRAARYLCGAVVLLALYAGLLALPHTQPWRLAGAAVATLWVAFLWPWLFVRAGLASAR